MSNRRGRGQSVRGASVTALVVSLALAFIGAPSAGSAARTPPLAVSWLAPTPPDGKSFTVVVDTKLAVPLAAAGKQGPVRITASGLAAGAVLTSAPGASANAELAWTPRRSQLGTHVFVFLGTSVDGAAVTRPRAIFVHVIPATPPAAREEKPIGTNGVYRWAYVARPAAVRARPSTASRVVTHLSTFTRDETVNLVLLLARTQDARGRTWYRVRLPILPNNSTGWILTGALTTTRSVSTYLVIYRKLFTATLYRNGVPVFQTRVGIGKPYWPTPAGDFYIREILTGFTDPMYGPVAFGTSARSAVLTDWHGGGGVVGIHGTNRPEILPGRVSHGCVRMRNAAIRRLHRLMPLGTPVAIR